MRKLKEGDIVNQCLTVLKLRGVLAWRQNTTGIKRRDRNGREFWAAPAQRGVSDILAVLPPCLGHPAGGVLLAVEVKTKTGRVSAEQECFLEAVSAQGGFGVVVCDALELNKLLDGLGLS